MEAWERIDTIMKEQGLNKNSLSRRVGLQNNVTITLILNKHRNPQLETLEKIAAAFPQYSRAWVLYGDEPKMAVDAHNGSVVASKSLEDGNGREREDDLLETLKRVVDQNTCLIESNERYSKSIEKLVDFLVSNGSCLQRQVM